MPSLPSVPAPPPAPTYHTSQHRIGGSVWVRGLYMALAVLSLATGIVGIFLPGLPTTVFILIAGWAAARSSTRLHAWLWNHRLFGSMLRDWAQGGCVSRRAKWSATLTMALCALMLWVLSVPWWARAFAITNMVCVLTWLWFRPEPPPAHPQP